MNKTMLVVAAGLLALTGAAMAEQSVVVNGNLHTPAGDVPVSQSTDGVPLPGGADLPWQQSVDDANAAFDEHGIPLEGQLTERGARVNVRCLRDVDPEGTLNPACTQEPTIEWLQNDYVTASPTGVKAMDWVDISSDAIFQEIPEEFAESLPPEQREALMELREQVRADANGGLLDYLGQRSPFGFRNGDGLEFEAYPDKLKGALAGFGTGAIGDGAEELLPPGWEEYFDESAVGLQAGEQATRSDLSPESEVQGSAGNGDMATLALAAVVVGGAIVAPMALYHRIRSNNALNNKTRQMVYDAVVRAPGTGVNDAARAANCSYSTAAYHLERLVEERLLIVSEDGRRARYFKNGGAFSQAEREFVPILQSKECMDVLQVIVENPWCYRAEVAQKLSVSGPTVNWHLKKLMNVGVVKEMREGRVSYLYADKKALTGIGANLVGKLPDDLVARLRFENRPEREFVEPAMALPETRVPDIGVGEYGDIELMPMPEAQA